jgi:hypothetical protein
MPYVCGLAVVLLFIAVFFAIARSRRVRAVFKGPLHLFSLEVEVDNGDSERTSKVRPPTRPGGVSSTEE